MNRAPPTPKENVMVTVTDPQTARLLSIREACDRLSIGRTKLYEEINAGRVRPVYIGRGMRIAQHEIARYIAELERVPGEPAA
jgi:excisionase family DNA binding protein